MKKILLTLGLIGTLGTLIGVLSYLSQPKIETPLKLKAPAGRIISWKVEKMAVKVPLISLLGGSSTSTTSTLNLATTSVQLVDIVHYKFVSNVITTATPYFDKSNFGNTSNAEILPKRKDGKEPIAFYADPLFYRTQNGTYNIEDATTTLVAFNEQMKPTLAEKFLNLFIDTAVATTTVTTTQTYTPPSSGVAEVLVVAGGGGAGNTNAEGGGGGGGVVYNPAYALTGASVSITIGNGGTGLNNGQDSIFGSITANGGGFGASETAPRTAGNGGSGGGGIYDGVGGTGSQGGNGGNGGGAGNSYPSGGGGGAGPFNGKTPPNNTSNGGNGGDGYHSNISGVSTTYAGGGGGGAWVGTSAVSLGGLGGGGNGGDNSGHGTSGQDGAVNTGGGAGGNGVAGVGNRTGGSGIVIFVFTPNISTGGVSTCVSFCSN